MLFSNLIALILTVVLEFSVLLAFIRKAPLKLLLYSLLINTATQVPALYIYQNLWPRFILLEIIIFLLESFLLMLLLAAKYRKALLLSFTANLATAMLSLIFFI